MDGQGNIALSIAFAALAATESLVTLGCIGPRTQECARHMPEAAQALYAHEARCIGNRMYAVRKERGVTVVEPWHFPLYCEPERPMKLVKPGLSTVDQSK